MQAAKKAGLPPSERRKFADANADGIMQWGKGSDPSPNDNDRQVKQSDYKKLSGTTSTYELSLNQINDLKIVLQIMLQEVENSIQRRRFQKIYLTKQMLETELLRRCLVIQMLLVMIRLARN